MAVAPRHLRCLFSQAARLSVAPTSNSTAFNSPTNTTPNLPQSRRLHSSPLTAYPRSKKGVPKDIASLQEPETKPYTVEQVEDLRKLYAPDQLEAILAGENAIDPKDFLLRRSRDGGDPYAIKYAADFAKYDPLLDFPQQDYIPQTGHPMQPLPVMDDPRLSWPSEDGEAGIYRGENLSRLTGFSIEQLKRFTVRSMVFHRVVNQTRMGKIQRFYALNIAGNGNGLIGIGEGKSAEPGDAGQIATYMALRNLEPIPRYEGRTIYGKVQVKIGAVELELRTAPPGYGVRASEPIFEICRCLGIQDLSAKITRSRNRMNVVKAVMHGLRNQKLPDTIARGRGLKLVDVRKTYYNGSNLGSSQFMGN